MRKQNTSSASFLPGEVRKDTPRVWRRLETSCYLQWLASRTAAERVLAKQQQQREMALQMALLSIRVCIDIHGSNLNFRRHELKFTTIK